MSLAQNAYIDASNVYENSLENSYKKVNGVFYTNLSLAEKNVNRTETSKRYNNNGSLLWIRSFSLCR